MSEAIFGPFSYSCLAAQSYPTLCDPMDCSPPGSAATGLSRQEYCSGLPFFPPGELTNPGIRLVSPTSAALAGGFFTTSATGGSLTHIKTSHLLIIRNLDRTGSLVFLFVNSGNCTVGAAGISFFSYEDNLAALAGARTHIQKWLRTKAREWDCLHLNHITST